jgi:hypothetical protein
MQAAALIDVNYEGQFRKCEDQSGGLVLWEGPQPEVPPELM